MADETPTPNNALLPVGGLRSTQAGDVPERLKRRYYVEDHNGDRHFFVDARTPTPAFEDRGRQIVTRRADPNAVRDMMEIAAHRGWRMVDARGAAAFRREAWLAGRAAGLEVRGYRPTERDLQALDRQVAARDRRQAEDRGTAPRRDAPRDGATDRLRVVETVIRTRIADPARQTQLLSRARQRIADWLERGAHFAPVPTGREATPAPDARERRRAR